MFGIILDSARRASADSGRGRVSPTIRLAAMTMGTLTSAKLLLRVQRSNGDDFQPAVWERLEQRSDDLASEHYDELTAGYEGVTSSRLKGECEYLHLVRTRTGVRWCATTIDDDEPSPFPEGLLTSKFPQLADAITWKIIGDLASVREALTTRGTPQQRTSYLIAETIALAAAAKLHLAIWGNGKLSAAFETLADRVAASQEQQLLSQDE